MAVLPTEWCSFRAEIGSYAGLRDYLLETAGLAGAAAEGLPRLELALEEAALNIISYAYADGGELWVRVSRRKGRLRIELADFGTPFDPLQFRKKAQPDALAECAPGGLGIPLMKRLCSELHYERRAFLGRPANVLTLIFTLSETP